MRVTLQTTRVTVVSKNIEQGEDEALPKFAVKVFDVVCSWCGEVIRSSATEESERMCLICHARMLNDYFQRLHRAGGGKQLSHRRSKNAE